MNTKQRKSNKRIIVLTIIGILLLWISTLFMGFTFSNPKPNNGYEYVMNGVIKDYNAKITDIAMLGSHDAFSNEINLKSKGEKNEGGIANNGAVNLLGKGFCVRMTKAQSSNAMEQLYAGVRYFDLRVAHDGTTYYTHHSYLSGALEGYISDIVEFLSTHPGEVLLLDIQDYVREEGSDARLDKSLWDNLFQFMNSVKSSDGTTLSDYIFYTTKDSIKDLTYGKLTNNGISGGVVLLGKTHDSSYIYFRDGDASHDNPKSETIRSYWNNKNSESELLEAIDMEMEYIKENKIDDVFIVNQAQQTGFMLNAKILRSAAKWSLLDMGASFNKKAVSDEKRFKEWLKYMPIYMVDNATSNKGSFNKLANQYIREYNETV